MPFTYPLSIPNISHVRETKWSPMTIVSMASSLWTGQQQTYVWPGQWWQVDFTLIPMKDPTAGIWEAFLNSLNGQEGTFKFGDPSRKVSRGNPAGSWVVGAGAVANSTTLPISGGTGMFAVGDWIQVGTKLHRVTQLIDATHIDVWPRLRSAYAAATPIIFSNAVGVFRLSSNDMSWSTDVAKVHGISISAVEDLSF